MFIWLTLSFSIPLGGPEKVWVITRWFGVFKMYGFLQSMDLHSYLTRQSRLVNYVGPLGLCVLRR